MKVGDRVVTVGELEDRLAGIPPFQLATFGGSRDEVVHAYVDQVLVRDLLLAEGAKVRGLDKKEPTVHRLARTKSSATLRAFRKELPSAAAIPEADVRAYYEEHRSRFDTPERVNLWRILCKTESDAQRVLDDAMHEPTIAHYKDLARDHSIDEATKYRSGNLGFVTADGVSNQAGLKVDPALVKAASSVKDGAFVMHPVAEGENFAVVWRRATVAPSKRSLEDATPEIRATLFRERTESFEKKQIEALRQANVRDVDPSLLGLIVLPAFDPTTGATKTVPMSPKK